MIKINNVSVTYKNYYLNIRFDYKQTIVLSLLLLSLLIDHITTRIGLINGFYEINSNVIFLMNNNLWFITDLFITFSLYVTSMYLSSFFNHNYARVFYLLPVITILLRLFVCFNNIFILLTLLTL